MGPRGRALIGIAAVAAAIVAVVAVVLLAGDDGEAAASGPVAAVQDDHLPVDPIEALPERLDMIAETGVTTTRVDLFWKDIAPRRPGDPSDPADPAYDFARADLVVRGLAERGIVPIVSIFNAPEWATDGRYEPPGHAVNTANPDPGDYADFMGAVATRYSGGFASADGETLPEVRHWELWNEPNLAGFFTPVFDEGGEPISLDNYAAMVEAAYPAIKDANPDAVVIAGVGGPRGGTGETGIGAMEWLRGLRERDIPLDAYSQHIYPAAAPEVRTDALPSWSSVEPILDELDGFEPGLPLYVTEAGYTTAETPFRDRYVTEEEQARYLTQIFRLPQLATDRVPVVVWFNLQDNANWPAGLMREDLSRKPSYEAFRDVVEAQGGARLGGG